MPLRDAEERLIKGGDFPSRGLVIEEITKEAIVSDNREKSKSECSVSSPQETSQCSTSQTENFGEPKPTNTEHVEALKDDPASIRSFQDFISHADPETLSAISGGKVEGISPDTVKTASKVVSRMSPEELQRMFQLASFFPRENSFSKSGSSFSPGSNPPDLSPTATDMMSKFSPEELQKMFEMTSSLKGNEAASSSSLGFHTSPGLDPPNVTPNMLKMATDMMGKMSPKEHFKRV